MDSLTTKPEEKELETVTFFREVTMLRPEMTDLLTLEDMDEHKVPALNNLLKHLHNFRLEMASVNIHPEPDERDRYKVKNLYLLTDSEYEDFESFEIRIKCNWFDSKWKFALHAGFDFFLYVNQDGYKGRGEIADWIKIQISHLNIVPSSLGSCREHVRCLVPFVKKEYCYFNDISMDHTHTVSFGRMADGICFKTELFNKSVNDACFVMKKIIKRKDFLKVVNKKN